MVKLHCPLGFRACKDCALQHDEVLWNYSHKKKKSTTAETKLAVLRYLEREKAINEF